MPTASIVIPTFNRSRLLKRALESILSQTFSDFEVIIVDDGGQDDTQEVVTKYADPRFRYLKRVNGGISAARNSGLNSATGDWITFLDDDDEALPEWLSTFDELFSDSKVGIACVGVTQKWNNGTSRKVLPRRLNPIYERAVGLFMGGSFASRPSLLREVGGFADGLACSHATELAMRLIPACRRQGLLIMSSNKVLVQINREDPTIRQMRNPERLLKGVNYILETHADILKRSPEAVARYLCIAGVAAAKMGLYSDSRKFFFRSVRSNPWSPKSYLRLFVSLNRRVADQVWKYRNFNSDSA